MASGMRPDTCLRNPNGSAAMNEAARILTAIENGDRQAAEQLLPFVYDELRRLAARKLARESPGHTLQATALVHQAYLRLVGDAPDRQWNGRSHFFAAAAQAMRHVLVGAARRKRRQKRGGGIRRVEFADVPAPDPDEALLALDDALSRLANEDPVAAKVIELRQFAGLGHDEIAAALGITVYLARQKWTYARAWLGDVLGG
jgi:RNA polymerase sigma factor (TIGR02999 family)